MSKVTEVFEKTKVAVGAAVVAVAATVAAPAAATPAASAPSQPAATVASDDIKMTAAGEAYFGKPVADFIRQQGDKLGPTVVATPADCKGDKAALSNALGQAGAGGPKVANIVCNLGKMGGSGAIPLMGPAGRVNVLLVMENGATGADHFKGFAGLPPSANVHGIKATSQDYKAFTAMHELGHSALNHSYDNNVMGAALTEVQADKVGNNLYVQAQKAGAVSPADIKKEFLDARIMKNFMHPDNHKMGHGVAGMPSFLAQVDASDDRSGPALTIANNSLGQITGEVHIEAVKLANPDKYAQVVASVALQEMRASGQVPKVMLEEMTNKLVAAQKGDPEAQKAMNELAAQMEPGLMNSPDSRAKLRQEAGQAIKDDILEGKHSYSPYMVQAASKVLADGRLKEVPHGPETVQSFIKVANERAPDFFKPASPEGPKVAAEGPKTAEPAPEAPAVAHARPKAPAPDMAPAPRPRGGGFGGMMG